MSAGSCTKEKNTKGSKLPECFGKTALLTSGCRTTPMRQLVKVYNLKRIALFHDNAP